MHSALFYLPISFPAPIILALALNMLGGKHFKKFMQTLTYVLYFVATVVMVGIILQCLPLDGYEQELVLQPFELRTFLWIPGKVGLNECDIFGKSIVQRIAK